MREVLCDHQPFDLPLRDLPLRSPDFSTCDFLWDYLKSIVYQDKRVIKQLNENVETEVFFLNRVVHAF